MKVVLNRLSVLFLIATLWSCSSPKELVLLQNNPEGARTPDPARTVQLQDKQYKLRASDRIMLHVFSLTDEKVNFLKEPQIELVVNPAGQIELPVIGQVPVAGLTIQEAEDKIKKTASEYLRSPSVTIRLANFYVTVLGEVNRQGTYLIPEPRVNLLEALGQAGGLTENANRESIRIVRQESNAAKIYQLNLLDDKSISSQNFFLQPNDVVLINPRKSLATRQERIGTIGLLVSLTTSMTFLVLQAFRN